MELKECLRDPVPELFDAARLLDAGVTACLRGHVELAGHLFQLADDPSVREWTESLWGKASPYVKVREVSGVPPALAQDQRIPVRMPNAEERRLLRERDGYHCRFCGIPVIRKEIRERVKRLYPAAVTWGRTNFSQHAAFQALWLQYDHVLPHSRGGDNSLDNLVITCAPCNYAKWNYHVTEIGLLDPRSRPPRHSWWDGLERFKS